MMSASSLRWMFHMSRLGYVVIRLSEECDSRNDSDNKYDDEDYSRSNAH